MAKRKTLALKPRTIEAQLLGRLWRTEQALRCGGDASYDAKCRDSIRAVLREAKEHGINLTSDMV